MITVSPQIGEFLIRVTHIPDIDAALKKVLSEYIELKIIDISEKKKVYELKWNMSFREFKEACKDKTVKADVFSYEVEKEFWEWESLDTLLHYYEDIKSRWI